MKQNVKWQIKIITISILIVFLLSSANAAKFDLKVEKKGSYVYWFEYKTVLNKDAASLPQKFKGDSVSIDTNIMEPGFIDSKLFVMDKKTYNIASIAIPWQKDAILKPIELIADDFKLVKLVKLRIITKDGAPLERAIVNIVDGEGNKLSGIITPADFGVVEFKNVAAGEINVKVDAENLDRTVDSDISLELDHPTPYFEKDIKVTGDVDTVEAAIPSKTEESSKESKSEKKSSGGNGILQMLAGFVFVALIAGVLYAILRSKGVTAKGTLNQMGVTMSDDSTSHPTPIQPTADSNTCQFCGQVRDANGRCACTIGAATAPVGVSDGPKLVGIQGTYSGTIFKIAGTGAVIGRELPADITLSNDHTVSRKHASISVSGAGYSIKDEGSSNGTSVNGVKITEQSINPGDEILIGGTKFRFEI
jgi:hypothetical protein